MEANFPARLRGEIKHSIQRRHEFSMRKISFCAALLGFGTLNIPIGSGPVVNLNLLLYLVPAVAIAFDFYIVSDDFRVKRVGAFLKKEESGSCDAERLWEKFVDDHDNKFAPIAFFFVTVILLAGATILLLHTPTTKKLYIIIPWGVILFLIDLGLLIYSRRLRRKLKEDEKKKAKEKEISEQK